MHARTVSLLVATTLALAACGATSALAETNDDMPGMSSGSMSDMPGMDHATPTPSPSGSSTPTTTALSLTIGAKVIKLTQPTDPQLGKLVPAKDAASRGMFGPQVDWPLIPIHAALSRTGHLIAYGTPLGDGTRQAGIFFDNWDPKKGFGAAAHVDTDSMGYDSFCNSLMTMADGRLLMVGGNSAMSTMIYDPVTNATVNGANLNLQRWYATTLRLTDGRMLVLGGSERYNLHTLLGLPPGTQTGTTPEIGDGVHPWTVLKSAASKGAFGSANSLWFYPRAFNGPRGTVVGFSNFQLWEITQDGKTHLTGKLGYSPAAAGSQVMYTPGKVLVASGGAWGPDAHTVAKKNAVVIDFTGKRPKVSKTNNVLYPGNWLNLTVLPDGRVLANGGTIIGTKAGAANADRTAEIWNPATGKWSRAATAKRTRTYHSTSLLLPSGAVFTGGGGAAQFTDGVGTGPEDNMNAELYYPAYLFAKDSHGSTAWAKRPAITSISGSATYGGRLKLGMKDAGRIKSASLISLPTVTHSENTDQRRVPLTIKQAGRSVTATLPKSVDTLPPGDYELTVVNSKSVPSPAQILTIRKGRPGLVTPAGA